MLGRSILVLAVLPILNLFALLMLAGHIADVDLLLKHIEDADLRIMDCLHDDNRVVRAAACLACAKLKISDALDDLLHLRRNDAITDVRSTAEAAVKVTSS